MLRFCLREEDNSGFRPPTLKEVQKYRIVVATLATAAKLHNLGVSRGHFQTIFVDEGGQALEPEGAAAAEASDSGSGGGAAPPRDSRRASDGAAAPDNMHE